METSISLTGGNPCNSSGNTSRNSLTTGILAKSMLPFFSSFTWASQAKQPFLSNFPATKTEITQLGITFLFPLNTTLLSLIHWIVTVLVKQSTCALCLLSQSMPRIKSKSYSSNDIRSTLNSNPPTYSFTPL